LLATSTHDTKRSEDVRARMAAISETPQLWRRSIQRWRFANRRWKKRMEEVQAPDGSEEYLLYQTLLGTWPINARGEAEQTVDSQYAERIQAYMAKALNEAKLNTSWIQPHQDWLDATREFIAKVLEQSSKNKFLPALYPVVEEIARLGAVNSLSQTLLKLTSPGVPDIYQGCELWDFSLVDPDNRRAVDYQSRRATLASIKGANPEELWQNWPDGRIKLFLTNRVLQFRRDHVDLFRRGSYLPVKASGTFGDCVIGFAREFNGQWIVVIAPRLTSRVGFPPLGDKWQDTIVDLPESLNASDARDLFTGRQISSPERQWKIADALSVLPFAAVTNL